MPSASSLSNYSNNESSSTSNDGSWITWYIGLRGNEFLTRVPEDFIRDKFNLMGLETLVANYYHGLDIILDMEFENEYGVGPFPSDSEDINAVQLYGLIHARYINTIRGADDMAVKYERGDFGVCPRVYCRDQHTLPMGLYGLLGIEVVKMYCPRCCDIYHPRQKYKHIDGAYFGQGFPHNFFLTLPHLRPDPPKFCYEPRLYGFKVYKNTYMPANH